MNTSNLTSAFIFISCLSVAHCCATLDSKLLDSIYESRYYEQIFQLSNRNICKIQVLTFKGLEDLRNLNLSRNALQRFDLNTFFGMSNLEILDLSYNKINQLDKHTFAGLTSIEYIDLRGNLLSFKKDAPWFSNPDLFHLTDLDLSNNKMQFINEQAFNHMINLNQLNLDNNQILELKSNSFKTLKKIEVIMLRNNNIKKVDKMAFNSICAYDIKLSNNPITKYLKLNNISRSETIFKKTGDKYSHSTCIQVSFKSSYASNLTELIITPNDFNYSNKLIASINTCLISFITIIWIF